MKTKLVHRHITNKMELSVVLILGFLAFSQGKSLNNFNPSLKIVNGQDAEEGEFPFQVSLQVRNSHFCGGSIVNEHYVVTAAHCVYRSYAELISVVVGTVDLRKPQMKHNATKIIVHERYTPRASNRDDIALIRVATPFLYSKLVQPIALPELHAKIRANATAVISGWGEQKLGANGEIPDILQKVKVYIIDQQYCQMKLKEKDYDIYPTQICANDPNARRGECYGDSGGPVTVDGKLTGIVSWSIKDPYCGSPVYPGVHTRVPEYVDWILQHAV